MSRDSLQRVLSAVFVLAFIGAMAGAAGSPPIARAEADPARLLEESDRGLGGDLAAGGLTWTSKVTSTERGKTIVQTFQVKVLGENARIECVDPEKNRGDLLLFNDRTLWFHRPGFRKPITMSTRQRLSGRAANGDVAFTRFARDYEASLSGEDKKLDQLVWKLELKARSPQVTYDRVRYFVSQKSRLGIYAEFLTKEGRLFKTAEYRYDNVLRIDGKSRPFLSRVTIHDAAFADLVTVLELSDPKVEKHPPELFDVKGLTARTKTGSAGSQP